MIEALQKTDIRAMLLANRELLSLERATRWLITRERIRTPLGAAELLELSTFSENGRGAYDKRVEIVATIMWMYRDLFPREYRASLSPAFSLLREQEFYYLVGERLFPLEMEDDPRFFWPGIPITGTQQHDWLNGCCRFEDLQTVFKLVLVLMGAKPGRSPSLGLKEEPAPPLSALGWTHFAYACAVELSPLRYLPQAFNLCCYRTGNPWLDIPTGQSVVVDWSAENVAMLFLARRQAEEINSQVLTLDKWLDEDPTARIARAVGIWNKAAKMEGEG